MPTKLAFIRTRGLCNEEKAKKGYTHPNTNEVAITENVFIASVVVADEWNHYENAGAQRKLNQEQEVHRNERKLNDEASERGKWACFTGF